jgi:DNA-3-methyladenine glycosylase
MFGPAGAVYVYRSYGLHWCMNVVCEDDRASAVLIRALEPLEGIAVMETRRGRSNRHELCSGPGRLCEALGVSRSQDGDSVLTEPFAFATGLDVVDVVASRRIGISKAVDLPWRFSERGSRFLSRAVKEVPASP